MQWAILDEDGDLTLRTGEPTLERLQEAVGGYIEECSPRTSRFSMFVNDDGFSMLLPMNPWASIVRGELIVGPAVFTGPANRRGDLTSLTSETLAEIATMAGVALP